MAYRDYIVKYYFCDIIINIILQTIFPDIQFKGIYRPAFDSLDGFRANAEKRFGARAEQYLKLCDPDGTGDLKTIQNNAVYNDMELGGYAHARMEALCRRGAADHVFQRQTADG